MITLWRAELYTGVVIVDVQRDFCDGSLAVPGANKIIGVCNTMMQSVQYPSQQVFLSRDWHPYDTPHFDKWPRHCVAHTVGAEFHPGLMIPLDATIIAKGVDGEDAYSAFQGQDIWGFDLESNLKLRSIKKLYIMGLATDYCVKETVLSARRLGLEVVVIIDGCAAVNADPYTAFAEMFDAGANFRYLDYLIAGK